MRDTWTKPVILALEAPGKFTTIHNATEASWAMIEDWPLEDGPALDRALLICAAVAEGKKSPEDARRAFVAAALEAGIETKS
ncbi:DUF982 domain-containing protein [Rhizobium alvei]|uniref:DUF982 domain-containing protein n=1 Tax=Rhizobium alvei TaxID=1132659 RepID=A0ABT8YKE5_9HYPH|nr:DUF982 domain-containing protein [Rhizobium alvei]MDO6964140.1 DUF982 domain-containing protein [Rhizobium alvei]